MIAAAAALLLSGCSEAGFPAVHDLPSPRADTTLTPDQVKQATEDLAAQRDHLNTEATGQVMPVSLGAAAQQQKGSPPVQAAAAPAPAAAAAQGNAADDAMTAGAYAKP